MIYIKNILKKDVFICIKTSNEFGISKGGLFDLGEYVTDSRASETVISKNGTTLCEVGSLMFEDHFDYIE